MTNKANAKKLLEALTRLQELADEIDGVVRLLKDADVTVEEDGSQTDWVVPNDEAAKRLGVSPKTLWTYTGRGLIQAVRPLGQRKSIGVTASSLAAFIAGRSQAAGIQRDEAGIQRDEAKPIGNTLQTEAVENPVQTEVVA